MVTDGGYTRRNPAEEMNRRETHGEEGSSAMKEILIYGAGDAGMTAAINLAREGYAVTVRDREKGIGGSGAFNPSAHSTPMDVGRTSEYIGIDLSGVMHGSRMNFYIQDTPLEFKDCIYTVERGDREGSLDQLLYQECLALGVEFEFGTRLSKEDIPGLPPRTILALGLSPAAYEMLGLPHMRWNGYMSRGESGFSDYCLTWMGKGITDYGYFSTVNGLYYNLLISTEAIGRDALARYEDFLMRKEGVESREWVQITDAVPLPGRDYPRLFHDQLILAGTLGGWIDPIAGFGILGSLISGKVAAMAVTDPEAAQRELRRFTHRFAFFRKVKHLLFYPMRPYVGIMERAAQAFGVERAQWCTDLIVKTGIPGAIPGFAKLLGCY